MPRLRAGALVVEADLIVFDKDGVLLDFHRLWDALTAARVAALGGGDELHALLTRLLPIATREQAIAAAAILLKSTPAAVRSGFETADAGFDRGAHTHPFPGVVEAVTRLHHAGFALAVATSDRTDGAMHFLRQAGIAGLFTSIVGADRVAASKPAPDMVRLACAEADVPPGRTVVVGDHAIDMGMGRSAGVAALIGVRSGVGDETLAADVLIPGAWALDADA